MLDRYVDRWALVTGASSGIGAEFARQLAARGMHLVLTARRSELMEELADELHTRHGTRTEILTRDLSDSAQVTELMRDVESRNIDVELLINNAGFGLVTEVENTDPHRVQELLRLNIAALTQLTYWVLPQMLERQHGAIVNVSSLVAFQPVAYMPAYAASKAFSLHFSEALWAEVRDRGVTVMALCPGTTATGFFNVAGVPGWLKKQRSQTPEQVVKAALKALEKRRQYTVTDWPNYLLSLVARIAPRKIVVTESMKYFRPQRKEQDPEKPGGEPEASAEPRIREKLG